MCRFKSGIIFKGRVVLAPDGNESHSDLLEKLGVEDNTMGAMTRFVRAELLPKDGNKATPIEKWRFNVDQDMTPEWFDEDRGRYEQEFRDAVKEYMKDKVEVIAGYAWNPVKDGGLTYYFMDGIYKKVSEFGKTNNYATSAVRKDLTESDLVKRLQEQFGDKLVPIELDLTSLDGLDDYEVVKGDLLAIPNIDLYRRFRKRISKLDTYYVLATPDSTPSGYGACDVQFVDGDGDVGYDWCGSDFGVRPFFILRS